ncbi:MAG: mechanosensitive ion channel family protein [Candidatus Micrarchaeota archaeon]
MADIFPFLNNVFFGNTVLQYAESLLIILASVVVAKVMYYLIKKYVYSLTAKTKSDLDDVLVDIIEEPAVFIIVILGIWYSRTPLTLTPELNGFFNGLIGTLITLDIAWLLIRVSDVLIQRYLVPLTEKSKSKLDDQLLPILKNGIRSIIVILALLSIFSNFGYDITAIIGGLGIAGIAIAMAAKDSLGNLLGGATIFTDRPFEVGDEVKIGGVVGNVEEVGMRSTRVRTFEGTLVIVPNADVAGSAIENYTKAKTRRVRFNVGVEYDTSPKKIEEAKRIIKDIMKKTEGLDNKNVSVYFTEFGDSALNLMVTYHVKDTSRRFELMDVVNTAINKEFAKAKIGFAYPTQTVYVKK